MRVNVYSEELTDRIEVVTKVVDGITYDGVRFYLELPVMPHGGGKVSGPFVYRSDDDRSSAVTFWSKGDLRDFLSRALFMLHNHYDAAERSK